MYQGHSIQVTPLEGGFAELCFDRQGDAINKLDARTIRELAEACEAIASADVRGVLVTSAKSVFIVGADITEFGEMFKLPVNELAAFTARSNRSFNALEDLTVPTVAVINGFALGGGLETALCTAFRVMSSSAQIGLPEVKLGLFPGYGGTVRLPRLAGVQVAIDWLASGQPQGAAAALAAGVVDAVADPERLRDEALALLRRAAAGELDWRARQTRKQTAVPQVGGDLDAVLAAARPLVARRSGPHQPAALAALDLMAHSAGLDRTAALAAENLGFATIARTQAADAMVQAFLNEQSLKKLAKRHAKAARPVQQAAVLGAGIMGGGIAYASAERGTPVRLKDITQVQLDLGIGEARKQLAKRVKAGRIEQGKADAVLATIRPQLDYSGFDTVDLVVEAVVENLGVKHRVLTELEAVVRPETVIASNTSSLRIDDIVRPLSRPGNVVGMHFFNPVPVMPLVEIIQGSQTSDAAVSTAVGYAVAMGKTPIVVKDCPGFLVNRVLTAYMRGFLQLVADGADFEQVDRVMEAFGWPMGPAYLEDVVGIDTGSHVNDVISAGYPDRMPPLAHDALRLMATHQRHGQKNGIGFYRYEADPGGRPKRSAAADSHALLAAVQPNGQRAFSDAEIIDRMMLPMVIESSRALEEGVVGSAAELDTALLLGLGFPAHLGGPLKWADWLGLKEVNARAAKQAGLGKAYEPTARMLELAETGRRYHGA